MGKEMGKVVLVSLVELSVLEGCRGGANLKGLTAFFCFVFFQIKNGLQ